MQQEINEECISERQDVYSIPSLALALVFRQFFDNGAGQ